MNKTADAIRKVTAAIQQKLDAGRRLSHLDAYDLVDVLLAIADEIDPPLSPTQPKTGPRRTKRRTR